MTSNPSHIPAGQTAVDAELFEQFRAGSDSAFAELVGRHSRRLQTYCLALLHDAEATRDVMQEAWERLARMRGGDDPVANPSALLITIVRNLSLNYIRDRRHHLSVDDLADAQHPATSEREKSHMEEMVSLALERLPLVQREVIILHVYSGYSYIEIADILETSVDAVRMRAMRGRAHLAGMVEAMVRIEDARIQEMDLGTPNTETDSEDEEQ